MILLKYTLKNIYQTGPLNLKPGANEIPDIVWDTVKNWKAVTSRIESGAIQIVTQKTGSTEPVLSDLDVKEANKLILVTADRELLKKWASLETRKNVLKAIEDQIKLITHPKEKKKDD